MFNGKNDSGLEFEVVDEDGAVVAAVPKVRCVVTATGDIQPCGALEGCHVSEGFGLLGIVRQRVTDLKRTWVQYVFKWQSPQCGVVLKYCPFCGAPLFDHPEE